MHRATPRPLARAAVAAALAALLAPVLATARWEMEDSRNLEKTFRLPGGRGSLLVDNINGPITVTGTDGDTIRLKAREVLRADSQEDLERARREVRLDAVQEGGDVRLVVDGPFRDRDGHRRHHDQPYEMHYDFELQVPRAVDLDLRTVNGGAVRVEGVRGERFRVANVNGEVSLEGLTGSGSARTVNGPLTVTFHDNPGGASSFSTVNGQVEVAFGGDLAADLRFKTLNGEVFSDFPFEYLSAAPAGTGERHKGRFVYRRDRAFGVRVGGGGPEHSFETVNGDIVIRRQGR